MESMNRVCTHSSAQPAVPILCQNQLSADSHPPSQAPHLPISGALGGSRTPNLLIRSQMLYPIELRALAVDRCPACGARLPRSAGLANSTE